MRSLLNVIYRYRAFLIFILLELICTYLVVRNNNYQGAAFFNSANAVAGSFLDTQSGISDYLDLKDANNELADENARLRMALDRYTRDGNDTTGSLFRRADLVGDYLYLPASVINNSTRRYTNYITIDRGTKDGIEPGMGVIGPSGVVGRVKAVSKNFATVTSLLHGDMLVSSQIRRTETFGSTAWPGRDATSALLRYVPRSESVIKGDTVITSGYNAVYPKGILIGIVNEIGLQEDASYFDITMKLATDFSNLSFVYVVDNRNRIERDSLESITIEQ
ncbi:MAG: rod shape-determining protein MreC [Cyclobacteriaceae bacterium]